MLKWLKNKKPDEVFQSPGATPESNAPNTKSFKRTGDELVRAGLYVDAERSYRLVPESDTEYPGAVVMLGFVLRTQGRLEEAREVLERAVHIASRDADAHFLLGCVYEDAGAQELAIARLQHAIELRPGFEQAHHRLIFAQQRLSQGLLEADRLEEAERSYWREISLTPDHFGPYHNLGVVLSRLGRHAEAIEQFKQAISRKPDSSGSHSSLAAAYTDLDDSSQENLELARTHYETAVSLQPDSSELHYFLGIAQWRQFQNDSAIASFDRAIELNPSNAKARWARVMLWAPAFSRVGDDRSRSGFAMELNKFEQWWAGSQDPGTLFVGELQPFFLSYQEENNVELFKQYGRICALAMERWLNHQRSTSTKRPKQARIRLGIVSADIRKHSVWIALIKGWLRSIDRRRFEIIVFSLADRSDVETAWARANSDVFIGRRGALERWVSCIQEQNCEILLYPALGLDPTTLKLASMRLAPVQMHTWGHPETSGLPTVDYFVSAECFEPADPQDHYSEQVVLLPHLGNRLQPLNLEEANLDLPALGIDRGRPILICPGTPFKYQPEHDHVFADIARRVPNAQMIFFQHSARALANQLRERIDLAFESAGISASDHVRFIRWLSFSEFHSLLRQAHVMLDTIGFSGYNTAVQAMECGLPLVTREGRFLRGRLASGVLRRMGLQQLIVQTKAQYVELVASLAMDEKANARIRREIEERRSVLFEDEAAIGPLQDFLWAIARPIAPTPR